MLRQRTMYTANFNGEPPINHLLQRLQIKSMRVCLLTPQLFAMIKTFEIERFLGDFLFHSANFLVFRLLLVGSLKLGPSLRKTYLDITRYTENLALHVSLKNGSTVLNP